MSIAEQEYIQKYWLCPMDQGELLGNGDNTMACAVCDTVYNEAEL